MAYLFTSLILVNTIATPSATPNITPNDIGGYDYDLVDSLPHRLQCQICHLPSRDPYLSVCCGHLFCKSCLDGVKRSVAITNACPVCRDEEFVTFPNKAVNREIKSLCVYCTNKVIGCEWKGELNDINHHLGNSNGCQFVKVKCPNECETMWMQRQYLINHVRISCPRRKVKCQYCHDIGEHQFIEGQHKNGCPKLPLPCPNKCGFGNVAREDMEKHREECRLEVLNCFNDCGEYLERQYLSRHVNTECVRRKIACQYCHKKGEYQFIKGQHKMKCPKFPLSCPNKCGVRSVPREDMEAHSRGCPLEMIHCEYFSVGCETTMARKNQEKHNKDNMEDHLMKTTNQLAIALQRISTLEAITRAISTSIAAINESSLGWAMKLSAMTMMSKSDDQVCPVILKISDFNELKKKNGTWYSDFFYTHDKGYKMYLEITSSIKDSHLLWSVHPVRMTGPHDDNLPWPLQGNFEVKLLNQISDSQHCSITINYSLCYIEKEDKTTSAAGCCNVPYISNEDLNRIIYKATTAVQFLKDNCLFLQIMYKIGKCS